MTHKLHTYLLYAILIIGLQLPVLGQQHSKFKNFSPPQKHLLRKIVKYGKVESKNIGLAAIYSEQYARFDSLSRISSESDLILFTTYPSAAVKIYAFQKLIEHQNIIQALFALQRNIQDTTAFELQNGCSKGASIVGKSMYFRLKNAIEANEIPCDNQQKLLLSELNNKLASYTDIKKMVARQLKLRD